MTTKNNKIHSDLSSWINTDILISPRWHKLLNDLAYHRVQLTLAVISMIAGIFALGWILGSRTLMLTNIDTQYQASSPSTASFLLTDFEDGLAEYTRKLPQVAEADAVRSINARLFDPSGTTAAGSTHWRALELIAIEDFKDQRLNIPLLLEGVYPPPKNTIALERSSQRLLNAKVGDTVTIETLSGLRRTLTISSIVKDPTALPGTLTGFTTAYISFDTLEKFDEPRRFNQLLIALKGNNRDKEYVTKQMEFIRKKIEDGGWVITRTVIPLYPGRPRMETVINTMFLIISLAGSTIMFISVVLIANTMEAIMTQQIKQIGIMRLVGGTIFQVTALYFTFITFLAVLAVIFAIPLAALAAQRFSTFVLSLNNFDLMYPTIPLWVFAVQIVVGLSITWLASLKPILSSTLFLTIREAVSPSGTETNPSSGIIERMLAQITHFSGPALVAVRNIFRKKWRLMLTVITLGFGGAAFIAVFCIRSSMLKTVYSLHYEYNRYDLTITLSKPHRQEVLLSQIANHELVTLSEGWAMASALYIQPDGRENKNDPVDVIGLPPHSLLVKPTLLAGRWLTEDDEGCIVVNKYFFEHLPWAKLGSEVKLNIGGRERTWRIIGQAYGGFNINQNAAVYMSLKDYGKATNTSGKVNSLQIVLSPSAARDIPKAAIVLESLFSNAGYHIKDIKTSTEILFFIEERVAILTTVLLTLSFLLALVGGINLTNTMSTNVIERTREIGVMRAIGASSKILRQITVSEGLFISWFSWFFAIILSIPAANAATQRIGMTFIGMPLFFNYSFSGLGLWLLLVSVVAVVASLLPAQNAIQITVREAISYE